MKNAYQFLTGLFCLIFILVHGQTKQDTIKPVKVKSSWYVRSMPYAIYTGAGYQKDRVSQNIEVGKSFGPIDVGVAVGRISLRPDSTMYVQSRFTMDACQYGIFSNEFSVGAGYVFNSKTPLMLEISSTIFAQLGKNWGLGIITGYYDFSGSVHDSNKNYYGIFFRYGLLRNDGGVLVNRRVMHHHGK